MELPQEVQKDLIQYQALQNQLNSLQNQLTSLKLEVEVLKEAKKQVEEAEGDVYKAVGPVLIKKRKEDVSSWIDERLDLLRVKINSLEKKVQAVQNTMLKLKKKIEGALQTIQATEEGGAASG